MNITLQCDEKLGLSINSDTVQIRFKMFSLDLNSGPVKHNYEGLQWWQIYSFMNEFL